MIQELDQSFLTQLLIQSVEQHKVIQLTKKQKQHQLSIGLSVMSEFRDQLPGGPGPDYLRNMPALVD